VLYISGYAEHAVVRQGVLVEGIAFLSKPFGLGELARTVREVLNKVPVGQQ
jgi:two-component SAPR family response regulator